ncbi:MAG: hypothetical protein JW881_08185 [Spirochaetales bacterium]|nr:hypothetical protein [Spirochaetales bacterium]
MSFETGIDTFYDYGAVQDSRLGRFTYHSLGLESYYSGYPPWYANVVGSVRCRLEIKCNPFPTLNGTTRLFF